MELLQLIAVLFSATGFWKAVEVLLQFRTERKKANAEENNLKAQTESAIVTNWIQWSQTLERRVKELEATNEENVHLKEQIESQRLRISELEEKVTRMEEENQDLRHQLKKFSQNQSPPEHE